MDKATAFLAIAKAVCIRHYKTAAKIIVFYFLIMTVVGLNSCKNNKDDESFELTITGLVKESQTNNPLKKIRVYVYKLTGSGLTLNKELIGQDWTDSNGRYKITANSLKNNYVNIVAEGGKLGYIGSSDYSHKVSSSFFQYDVSLLIPGYASIKFINNSPQDSVSISVSSPQGDGATARNGIVSSFNTIFYLPAQQDCEIHIKVIRNGKETIDTVTLNIPLWDTTHLTRHF